MENNTTMHYENNTTMRCEKTTATGFQRCSSNVKFIEFRGNSGTTFGNFPLFSQFWLLKLGCCTIMNERLNTCLFNWTELNLSLNRYLHFTFKTWGRQTLKIKRRAIFSYWCGSHQIHNNTKRSWATKYYRQIQGEHWFKKIFMLFYFRRAKHSEKGVFKK